MRSRCCSPAATTFRSIHRSQRGSPSPSGKPGPKRGGPPQREIPPRLGVFAVTRIVTGFAAPKFARDEALPQGEHTSRRNTNTWEWALLANYVERGDHALLLVAGNGA